MWKTLVAIVHDCSCFAAFSKRIRKYVVHDFFEKVGDFLTGVRTLYEATYSLVQ